MITFKDIIQAIAGINVEGISEPHLNKCAVILGKFEVQCRRDGYVLGYNEACDSMKRKIYIVQQLSEESANSTIGYKK